MIDPPAIPLRDRVLIAASVVAGVAALPWLPGPWLADASRATTLALAFLLPATALVTSAAHAMISRRSRAAGAAVRASCRTMALATTALCSFALCLQVLILITLTDVPLIASAPARAVIVLFGLHVAVIGNVLPRLRPGWPGRAALDDRRYVAWQRVARTAGYLAVATGLALAVSGAILTGTQIEVLLKGTMIGLAAWAGWCVRQFRAV